MNKKRKSNTVIAAWITAGAVILAAFIYGGISLLNTGKSGKYIDNDIVANDSSKLEVTINQNDIQGDAIEGDKIELKNEGDSKIDKSVIEAPNALIVTEDQSGGINTVTINQVTSQSYQKISKDLKSTINKNLDNLKSIYKYHPKVILEIESGNSLRHKVASDLEQLLYLREMGYYPKGNTWIGRYPNYPVTILSSKQNFNFTIDFIKSIKPYIDSFYFIDTTMRTNESIKMYINGTPTFRSNGSLKIE